MRTVRTENDHFLMAKSPLSGINSLQQLLTLPYFEFMACLGEFSLHPGAENSTQELIRSARFKVGDSILEVGSGTGWTTRLLIGAGARVTVVEKSSRMLAATLRNCRIVGIPEPTVILADAENLVDLPDGHFDGVLYECVLGFVENSDRAISECRRVMKSQGSRVGVVDYHYVAQPPEALRRQLRELFGQTIHVYFEDDWRKLFRDFQLECWSNLPPHVSTERLTPEILGPMLQATDLGEHIPGLDIPSLRSICQRWNEWDQVFEANRQFLQAHLAVWSLG